MPHQMHGTGRVETNVPATDQARDDRLDRLIRLHLRIRRHLWTAILAFKTDPLAERAVFDTTTLISGPKLGCYLCEQPWSEEIHGQKCPGEPTDEPGGPW
jgi:hypothetical protein